MFLAFRLNLSVAKPFEDSGMALGCSCGYTEPIINCGAVGTQIMYFDFSNLTNETLICFDVGGGLNLAMV